jgi:protein-disulfide isomerase-like protein with CxxC motif
MPLEHRYCEQSLSFDRLKGRDIAAVDVLRQAADKVGLRESTIYVAASKTFEIFDATNETLYFR